MNRRDVLALLGGAAILPARALAQGSERPARIAFLSLAQDETRDVFQTFRRRLRQLGWIEGQKLELRFYFAGGGGAARVRPLAAEIAASDASVVLADGRGPSLAMLEASAKLPIVSVSGLEPVGAGLAASPARPTGNLTGITVATDELNLKRLELLRELVPSCRKVGIVYSTGREDTNRAVIQAGIASGLEIRRLIVDSPADAEQVLAPANLADLDAIAVSADSLLDSMSRRVSELINAAGKPAVYPEPSYAAAGGLVAYGFDMNLVFARLAEMVDQVLRGKKPADMPIEQYQQLSLVLNLKAARATGIAIPESLYARADEVIE